MKLLNLLRGARPGVRGKALPKDYQGSRGWETLLKYGWGSKPWTESDEIFGLVTPAVAEEAYRRHALVAACADLIASVSAEPRLEIGMERDDSDGWEAVKTHPLLDLFDNPQREISRDGLIKQTAMHKVLTGLGYVWKLRSATGRPAGLFPVPTSWVHPIPSKYGDRFHVGYNIIGQQDPVPVEDIVTMRAPDPSSPARGIGMVEKSFRAYWVDLERENYQAEMLANLKVPGVVVRTEHDLTPEQREAARQEFRERFGRGKRGDVAFMGQATGLEVVNPLADMDWPGLTGLSETRICSAAGVPPILVGARAGLDRATYSNYEQAKKAFYQATMAPFWESYADDLTLGFRDELGPRLRFRFRYDDLPAFQEDRNAKALRVQGLFQAGLIPLEVAWRELGYDPDEMRALLTVEDARLLDGPERVEDGSEEGAA